MNDPYALSYPDKQAWLIKELNHLTQFHHDHCEEYAKLLSLFYENRMKAATLSEVPYLPVGLFKTNDLLSIPRNQVFKILKSSGTTSSQPSTIFLDSTTAQKQSTTLASIMTSFLGPKRLPLLILDHPDVIVNRQSYSARGAALVGMMSFGRDVCYAFDQQMQLNRESVTAWLQKYHNESILLFGMTYIVWKYFLLEMEPINLPNGILFHTGGWKKMQEESVTNGQFKEQLLRRLGIKRCHNFYGMVEQVGSIFVECEHGHLHTPSTSDLIIRDPDTWLETDGVGIIQTLSTLPTSYPGHSLLTEDLGVIKGVDTCPCKRKGKYFEVLGRVPRAEIRGCSDSILKEPIS